MNLKPLIKRYNIADSSKCTYKDCDEPATAIHRTRYVCSLHYLLLKKESRLRFIEKQKEQS